MFQSDTEVLNIQVFLLRWEGEGEGEREGVIGAGSKKLLVLYDHEPQFYFKGKITKHRKKVEDDSKNIYHPHPFENGSLSIEY